MEKILRRKTINLLVLLATLMILAGCGQNQAVKEDGQKTLTVTTSFVDDMARRLAGDYVNIELIIPHGEDPHLYVAKPDDLLKIEKANLILYHGLFFEGKMNDVLEDRGVAITANFPEDQLTLMEDEGEMVMDPHFWFDLDLYKLAVEKAAEELGKLLPDHDADIQANMEAYLKELDGLDEEIKEKLAQIPEGQRYLVTPHDAFNYFSRAYGMEVIAPQGVSTDSEVANQDIEKTANLIVEHGIKAIFVESTTNPERMEKLHEVCKSKGFDVQVVSGEGQELYSDSLAPLGQKADNFIDMYRHNVDLIVDHLK